MAKAAFKENLEQVTLPSLATPKETKTAIRKLVDASPYTASTLQAFAGNDPIQDEHDLDLNPDINPKDVLRMRTNKIVQKYETPEEKEAEERDENFGLTHNELNRAISFAYEALYEPKATYEQSPYVTTTAAGFTARESVIGNDGKKYTAVYGDDNKLAYYDSEYSCSFNKGGTSSTVPAASINADLRDDSQNFNIKYKVDAKGNMTERAAADSSFQAAMADIDNQYTKLPYQLDMVDRIIKDVTGKPAQNDPSFTSFAASGVTTPVVPSEKFAAAATAVDAPAAETKSIMFSKNPSVTPPWAKVEKTAANGPTFEPSF